MSQKKYTTEDIVRLYGMYQPKDVMFQGRARKLLCIEMYDSNIGEAF